MLETAQGLVVFA